ncbi:hypothetical protein A1Q2_04607 [Trichosporon asahii var. asahii CBS 8904]|uniref:DUF1446 domain-containing protein n=1 Tax=Trichosporon asahii var. asahii (strain CBS 8904) TaxID=1220162 RepID=K1WI69_TRIAC|nr:hypothetical protein A1Q2_04607 [Trichosporon asahii var. asahii CBS 8904]
MPSGDQSQDVFRIAAFSGFTGDNWRALKQQASQAPVLFGDYLAEMRTRDPSLGYEQPFLQHVRLAADEIKTYRPKILTNAGALNPRGCAEAVSRLFAELGIEGMKIAYVEGDDLMSRLDSLAEAGEDFHHLEDTERKLRDWGLKPASANAYVGARGIYEALKAGADVVISGRCTDASPLIAAAAWHHGWRWDEYGPLAGALLAGHCLECGGYVTGGNSSGFLNIGPYHDLTMGIAEIARDGTFLVTKQPGTNGVVNANTVRSQILYEIQGNIYLNPDVTADIRDIVVTDLGNDRVRVTGVKGLPPPDTTKAAICAVAGYQAEAMIFATGLDVEAKFAAHREQIRRYFGKELAKFSVFDMTQYGVAATNPETEAQGTAMMRILAQSRELDAFGPTQSLWPFVNPEGLGHYPGFQWQLDLRTAVPTPFMEYWPGRVRQCHLPLEVRFVGSEEKITASPPDHTAPRVISEDYDSTEPCASLEQGATVEGPLGWIVHARSGDKGGNANVGLFVRHEDEYPWLKALLSKQGLIKLLGKEYDGYRVERVEFPGMLAVHFVIHDYLGKGVSSTVRMDSLAKGVAEFIRARYVDLPARFVERGKI